mgnify:CR=1 FL=1
MKNSYVHCECIVILLLTYISFCLLLASAAEAVQMASFSLVAPREIIEAGVQRDDEGDGDDEDDGWSAAALSLASIVAQAVEQGVSPVISSKGKGANAFIYYYILSGNIYSYRFDPSSTY